MTEKEESKAHFVLVAGLSSDHQEPLGLKACLEKRGYTADAISFYGDGYIDDFTDLRIEDCIANVSAHINRCTEHSGTVYGVGISLGGTLLIEHAKRFDNLAGIASIGTPYELKSKRSVAFGRRLIPFAYPVWRRLQKVKRLRLLPLGVVARMLDYLATGAHMRLAAVRTPVVLLHSKEDQVSDYRALPMLLDALSSERKEIRFFENGNHVINHDPDLVIRSVLEFFGLA